MDGVETRLSDYIVENGIDIQLPLVADMCGAMINTSVESVDAEAGRVRFYAPVFPGIDYRFAAPIGDYAAEFARRVPDCDNICFACNCVLNYFYGELEGKRLGGLTMPMTFGEIAYQLLNQTMVYLTIKEKRVG